MGDIRDRVLELRRALNLSQEAFGAKISLERSAISLIERKQRNVTERCIKDICREFKANEDWLRHAKGKMFKETDNTILSLLKDKYEADTLDLEIIEQYLKLKPEKRQVIKEYILSIASSYQEASPAKQINSEKSIDEQVEAFRAELESEKTSPTSQVLPNTNIAG